MKQVIAFVIFLLPFFPASAQDLSLSTYAETTVTGTEYGLHAAYESRSLWAIGGFAQQGNPPQAEEASPTVFYGLFLQWPFRHSEKISFVGTLRTGLIQQYISVVPGFETRMKITRRLIGSVGGAIRKGYPALYARLGVKIF